MKTAFNSLLAAVLFVLLAIPGFAQDNQPSEEHLLKSTKAPAILPSATYKFAQRDTCDLYLDVYEPAAGSETTFEGKTKPTIMFVFGGGFIEGSRADRFHLKWFKQLTDNGYRVVANDYRLGLKGAKNVGITSANTVKNAIDIAVEDLIDATAYLLNHSAELGIDSSNIVVSGSSAGAITSLQAEWYICNRGANEEARARCAALPEGFNYAGVMSFAGAIFSNRGTIKYATAPAPTLLLHGTEDNVVNYGQIWFFNLRFAGSNIIAKSLAKADANYQILRFSTYGHEISMEMSHQLAREFEFLEDNVMRGKKVVLDATIDDQSISRFKALSSRKDLYK